jgi:hypothetical protein
MGWGRLKGGGREVHSSVGWGGIGVGNVGMVWVVGVKEGDLIRLRRLRVDLFPVTRPSPYPVLAGSLLGSLNGVVTQHVQCAQVAFASCFRFFHLNNRITTTRRRHPERYNGDTAFLVQSSLSSRRFHPRGRIISHLRALTSEVK